MRIELDGFYLVCEILIINNMVLVDLPRVCGSRTNPLTILII